MTLARDLVRRMRGAAARPLPAAVETAARLHLLDALGVGLAAMGSPAGEPYRRYAATLPSGGPATLIGHPRKVTAAEAALVNGGLIHSLEYDDTHTASIAHGSAVLAAAALAAAEAGGWARAEGTPAARMLRVYALGWEVLIRMGLAAPGSFQARGFQVTSVGGALVAALVAAELRALDEETAVAAIGISLSTASGVFEFLSNGSTVKSLHPGWAAHSGLKTAALAEAGVTGPETAIEGRFGLFHAFAGDDAAASRFAASLEDFGTVWRLPEAAFKFHPCCHYLHPFIEAAGELAARGITVDAIESLVCRVPPGAAPIICEPWAFKQAASGHPARWSLPVTVAARLAEGQVDLATFETPVRPETRGLAARVTWEPLPDARFPQAFEAELVCRLTDGSTHAVRIEDAYGNASRPAEPEAVLTKFRANAGRALPPAAVTALEAAVVVPTASSDLTALGQALAAASATPERILA